jgi:hypothetical protein
MNERGKVAMGTMISCFLTVAGLLFAILSIETRGLEMLVWLTALALFLSGFYTAMTYSFIRNGDFQSSKGG